MELIFILVEPAVAENIGAAARAIKTMGYSELRLVNTTAHLKDEAKWLAHGSLDILEQARIYTNFKDAIADIDFKIASTAKQRSVKFDYYSPEAAQDILMAKSDSIHKAALIFGREESGLKNEELACCDMAITIPLKAPYPSINLAQAVMIIAYVFSSCAAVSNGDENNTGNYVLLKDKTSNILNELEIKPGENLFGRIMERLSLVKTADINLLLSLIGRLEKLLYKK